jgi:hypothetical protein
MKNEIIDKNKEIEPGITASSLRGEEAAVIQRLKPKRNNTKLTILKIILLLIISFFSI